MCSLQLLLLFPFVLSAVLVWGLVELGVCSDSADFSLVLWNPLLSVYIVWPQLRTGLDVHQLLFIERNTWSCFHSTENKMWFWLQWNSSLTKFFCFKRNFMWFVLLFCSCIYIYLDRNIYLHRLGLYSYLWLLIGKFIQYWRKYISMHSLNSIINRISLLLGIYIEIFFFFKLTFFL